MCEVCVCTCLMDKYIFVCFLVCSSLSTREDFWQEIHQIYGTVGREIYGTVGREITQVCVYVSHAYIYLVYIFGSGHPYIYVIYLRLWPTLHICHIYTALANPTCMVYIYMANPTCMVHIYGSGHPYIYGVHVRLWPTPQSLPATAAT